MPAESVSRSVPVLGRATLPRNAARRLTAGAETRDGDDIEALQLGQGPMGNGIPGPFDLDSLHLAAVFLPELLERHFLGLFVRYQDIRHVQGNAQSLFRGNLGTDNPHLGGQVLETAAQGDYVAPAHHDIVCGFEQFIPALYTEVAIFRMAFTHGADRLADGLPHSPAGKRGSRKAGIR